MYRKLYSSVKAYSLVQLFNQASSFLLIPFYTAALTPSDYGMLEYANIFSFVLSAFFTLQIQVGVSRFIADRDYTNEKNHFISLGLFITIAGSLLASILGLGLFYFFQWQPIYTKPYENLYWFFWLNFILSNVAAYLLTQMVWMLQSKISAWISGFSGLLSILSTIFFVLVLQTGAIGVMLGLSMGYTLSIVCLLWCLRRNLEIPKNTNGLKLMLQYSIPTIFSSIAFYTWFICDRLFLEYYHGLDEVGIFTLAVRFVSPALLVFSILENAICPLIISESKSEKLNTLLKDSFVGLNILLLIYLISIVFFIDDVYSVMVDNRFFNGSAFVFFIALSYFFTKMHFLLPAYSIQKKTGVFMSITLFFTLINAILSWVLIPMYKGFGAIIATAIATFFYIIVLCWQHQKYHELNFPFGKSILALFFTLCLYFLQNALQLSFIVKLILYLASLMVIAIIFYSNLQQLIFKLKSYFEKSNA